MKIFLFFIIISFIFASVLHAQAPAWSWVKAVHSNISEISTDVAVDPTSGDAIMVGNWGNSDLSAFFGSSAWSPTDFTLSYGNIDGFVAKYDPSGNFIWAFKIGGPDSDYVNAVDIDASGNIYITGKTGVGTAYFSGTSFSIADNVIPSNTGGTDSFVAKYSSTGSLLWIKYSDGTAGDFESFDVSVDNSSVYIAGAGQGSAQFNTVAFSCNNGGKDAFVARYDLNGNIQWVTVAGSINDDFGYSLVADNNYVYMTGDFKGATFNVYDKTGASAGSITNTTPNKEDIFLLSYDSNGLLNWAKHIGSNDVDKVKELAQDNNNLYLTGGVGWASYFPGYSGNPVLGTFKTDVFICSISKVSGNTGWVNSITDYGNNDAWGNDIAVSSKGRIYFTGFFRVDLTFPGPTKLTATGSDDAFIACYNTGGTFIWAKKAGSGGSDYGNGIAVDPQENIYVSGSYAGLASFDLLTAPDDNSSANIFLAKIEASCTDAVGGTAVGGISTLCHGGTSTISLSGYQGFISWQSSPAGAGTWADIAGGDMPLLTVTPTASTDYRAYLTAGTCLPASSNIVAITVKTPAEIANAGPSQTGASMCGLTSTTLAANIPTIDTGSWSIVSGTGGTVATPGSPTSSFSGTAGTTYVLRWTITNAPCTPSTSDVTIAFNQEPTTANAGPSQTGVSMCGLTSTTLAANTPVIGTGSWSIVSGTGGTVTTPGSPTSSFSGTAGATYVLRWTITNDPCTPSTDDLNITFPGQPVSNAGTGGNECDLDFQLQAKPSFGTGTWTMTSGTGTASFSPDANNPNAVVNVSTYGTKEFAWAETNSTCSSRDAITVNFYQQPVEADAGPDQVLEYLFSTKMAAGIPVTGTGTWEVINSEAMINDHTDPYSEVTNLSIGINTFIWHINNGLCPESSDEVNIEVKDLLPPTIITPNEDGLNDALEFPGITSFSGSELIVYNRWGSEIFRDRDYRNDWKGKDQKGRDLQIDTYYYILKISDGRVIKGFVEIRR